MSTEKTPTLFLSKTPFEYDNSYEKKACSRSTISWISATILLSLLIVVTIQFLFTPYDHRIRVYEEQPIEVRIISQRFDSFPEIPSDEQMEKPKAKVNTVNPWDFEFLIDPAELCATQSPPNSGEYERNPELKLLVLVPSSVDHFEQRNAIRNTWGSVAGKPHGPTRLGFVLGTTSNKTVDDLVHRESSEHGDIIQADFVDSYSQLTTKSVLMLKWVARRCPHAQYFLKADDDTFVNVVTIDNLLSTEPYVSQEKFIAGHIKNEVKPLKFPETEFYIAMDDHTFSDYPYASGSAYIMSIPTAIELFDAAQDVQPFLPQEDAFLTGLCAQYIDAPLIHEPSFVIDELPNPPSWTAYSTLATAHSVTPEILEQVWNDMAQSIVNSMFYLETTVNSTDLLGKKNNLEAMPPSGTL